MFGNGLRLTRMTLKATTLGNGIGYPVPTAPVLKTCIVTLIITKIIEQVSKRINNFGLLSNI